MATLSMGIKCSEKWSAEDFSQRVEKGRKFIMVPRKATDYSKIHFGDFSPIKRMTH